MVMSPLIEVVTSRIRFDAWCHSIPAVDSLNKIAKAMPHDQPRKPCATKYRQTRGGCDPYGCDAVAAVQASDRIPDWVGVRMSVNVVGQMPA
ncbi:hypothetical protein HR51_21255 [Burkholderia cepacia]|nr:hypothetical protein HR51_21255 [Burkholderia cepacia]